MGDVFHDLAMDLSETTQRALGPELSPLALQRMETSARAKRFFRSSRHGKKEKSQALVAPLRSIGAGACVRRLHRSSSSPTLTQKPPPQETAGRLPKLDHCDFSREHGVSLSQPDATRTSRGYLEPHLLSPRRGRRTFSPRRQPWVKAQKKPQAPKGGDIIGPPNWMHPLKMSLSFARALVAPPPACVRRSREISVSAPLTQKPPPQETAGRLPKLDHQNRSPACGTSYAEPGTRVPRTSPLRDPQPPTGATEFIPASVLPFKKSFDFLPLQFSSK